MRSTPLPCRTDGMSCVFMQPRVRRAPVPAAEDRP